MKKLILLAMPMVIGTAFINTAIEVRIKGSTTVLPISQKVAENYMKNHKDATISVTSGGSGVGITALIDGNTDIAMASRPMSMSEKMKLNDEKKPFKEVTIAYDALSVVVNPANKVNQLTREQLEGIFTGAITNWKEVGGTDSKIVAYTRESSSGTYEFFKEHVLKNKNFGSSLLMLSETGMVVQSVKQTPGAIGFIGLAYVSKEVKAVNVSYDLGKTFIKPSVENAKNKTYPVVRPLYYYYLTKDESKVKPFIDYIISTEGQKTIAEVGYIPLK